MNLEKEMEEYSLDVVSVWNKDGNSEKFAPHSQYLNLCEAISIAKQYAEEMCKKEREICADVYHKTTGILVLGSKTYNNILKAPLATEEK